MTWVLLYIAILDYSLLHDHYYTSCALSEGYYFSCFHFCLFFCPSVCLFIRYLALFCPFFITAISPANADNMTADSQPSAPTLTSEF